MIIGFIYCLTHIMSIYAHLLVIIPHYCCIYIKLLKLVQGPSDFSITGWIVSASVHGFPLCRVVQKLRLLKSKAWSKGLLIHQVKKLRSTDRNCHAPRPILDNGGSMTVNYNSPNKIIAKSNIIPAQTCQNITPIA